MNRRWAVSCLKTSLSTGGRRQPAGHGLRVEVVRRLVEVAPVATVPPYVCTQVVMADLLPLEVDVPPDDLAIVSAGSEPEGDLFALAQRCPLRRHLSVIPQSDDVGPGVFRKLQPEQLVGRIPQRGRSAVGSVPMENAALTVCVMTASREPGTLAPLALVTDLQERGRSAGSGRGWRGHGPRRADKEKRAQCNRSRSLHQVHPASSRSNRLAPGNLAISDGREDGSVPDVRR